MKKKYFWLLLSVFCLIFQNGLPGQAGEATATFDLPEVEIQHSIIYDDIFYVGSNEGQVTIRIEVLDLRCEEVMLTSIIVGLKEGAGGLGRYMPFDNPNWGVSGMEGEYHFQTRGTKSWLFTPTEEIFFDEGSAWVSVEITGRFYLIETDYKTWGVRSEAEDTTVQIAEKKGIPGFEIPVVLLALSILIRRIRARTRADIIYK